MEYILDHVRTYIKAKGGATFSRNVIVEYDEGYQVCTEWSDEIRVTNLDDAMYYINTLILCDTQTFGIWTDDDGILVIDTHSIHVPELDKALELARKAKQDYIWDWKNDTGIKVEG